MHDMGFQVLLLSYIPVAITLAAFLEKSDLAGNYLQEISPLPSAFAVYSAQSFGTVPYAAGCDANRSASMDSEASSYSPLPKRHCLRSCQLPDTPDALAHVQSCHWQQHHQQQHASAQPPILSDTQKLYAVKTMLQNSSSQQASTLLAYMQQLQHLQTAAACQTNTAQTVCAQQSSEHHNFAARARKIRHHLVGQQQQHHQQQQMHQPVSGLIHSDAMDFTRAPADSFMHQLPDMQTPVQQQELQASSVPHIDPEAYWQVQHRAAPHSVPYETTQLHAHHLCSQHQLAQPEQLWQSLLHSTQSSAPVSELHSSQTCAAYPVGHFLCVQQQASMLHQLTQAKHACMQHHLAQKQQAYAQRQLATVPRPAMGFAELAGYWAHGLKLQRCESVQLACHLWKRVQQQVSLVCFAHGKCLCIVSGACSVSCDEDFFHVSTCLLYVQCQYLLPVLFIVYQCLLDMRCLVKLCILVDCAWNENHRCGFLMVVLLCAGEHCLHAFAGG